MNNKYIWALLETSETEKLYAELNNENLSELTETLYNSLKSMSDDERLSYEGVEEAIMMNVIDGPDHSIDLGTHCLQRYKLNSLYDGNVMIDDTDFIPAKGAKIYEAAERINMGCDASYALTPVGYFTKKIDLPFAVEWIERTLN